MNLLNLKLFKTEKNLYIKYSKGIYYIDSKNVSPLMLNSCRELIQELQDLKFSQENILHYFSRYFEEIFEVNVSAELDNSPIGVDMDGEKLFESDKVYVVCISIQGPTIKEFTGLEYYKAKDYFELLTKMNMVLHVSKSLDKCWERFPSYLELWKTMKNN